LTVSPDGLQNVIVIPTDVERPPLFQVRGTVWIAASPDEVYAVISDLPRSGEWSVECTGGKWVSGSPSSVGAVFLGANIRDKDVVSWAPVIRGVWNSESEVVAADGRAFSWAMRDSSGCKQESIWSFDVEATDGGSTLVHRFWMGAATEGIRGITSGMTQAEKKLFFAEWGAKLEQNIQDTLDRIKLVIEHSLTDVPRSTQTR
jgi:hypothetical protein